MKLTKRIRALLGLEPSEDGQASPSVPVPPTSSVPVLGARSSRQQRSETVDPAEALPTARGQELLGPCRECDGYWTREVVRGQKPLTCRVCKRGD